MNPDPNGSGSLPVSASRRAVLPAIEETRLIAILRHTDPSRAIKVVESLAAGGVQALEVTLNSAGALEMLTCLARSVNATVALGAGTVLDAEAADAAIAAGARFVVTPHTDEALIRHVVARGVTIVPGAFTPSEIVRAWSSGATAIKVFPSGSVGPAYLKDLRGPFDTIPFIPTGGVTLENAAAFVAAGAWALGLGSALVDPKLVASADWPELTRRAAAFASIARGARRFAQAR